MHTVTKKVREWKVGEATKNFRYDEAATKEMAHAFIEKIAESLRAKGDEPIVISVSIEFSGMLLDKRAKEGGKS